ncbi:T9SS type A sorting domain-containing protein [bacterium]|nr:T9SS type A sorting domain-containing protein [bacterium]
MIPRSVVGQIELFNVLGQRIAHSEITPGRSSYDFDLSECPNGVYLVTVTMDGERATKKLLVIG